MRIVTANLANGRVPARALEAALRAAAPDLAVFQELSPPQAEVARSLLPYGRLMPATDSTGMGIASRGPSEIDALAMAVQPVLVARLGELTIVNVHLAAPHVPPPWTAFRQRRAQVEALRGLVAGTAGPLLLLGDLNATPLWPAYRALVGQLEDLASPFRLRTWRPTARLPYALRIDHLLGRGVRCASLSRVDLPGGDHAALVAEIEAVRADQRSGSSSAAACSSLGRA